MIEFKGVPDSLDIDGCRVDGCRSGVTTGLADVTVRLPDTRHNLATDSVVSREDAGPPRSKVQKRRGLTDKDLKGLDWQWPRGRTPHKPAFQGTCAQGASLASLATVPSQAWRVQSATGSRFDWAKLLVWSCALAVTAGLYAVIVTIVYLILLAAGVTS